MGRGRAKAKQTKVARELKYSTRNTDFDALQRELTGPGGGSLTSSHHNGSSSDDDELDPADPDGFGEPDEDDQEWVQAHG